MEKNNYKVRLALVDKKKTHWIHSVMETVWTGTWTDTETLKRQRNQA